MPIFDFTCRKCSVDFELLIPLDKIPKCPKCGEELTKLFPTSPPNFQLKGDGWTGSKIAPLPPQTKK